MRAVEKTLLDQENVENASVNLVQRTALIELTNEDDNIERILTALTNRGFPAQQRSNAQQVSNAELNSTKLFWKQWKQLMIALILLLLSVIGHLAEGGKINIPILGTLPFHASLATVSYTHLTLPTICSV